MKQIPFHKSVLRKVSINAAVEALESGWLTSGPRVKQFEEEFAKAVGASHAIAVSSNTMGFMALFMSLNMKGKRVAFPVWTFSGPAMMAHLLGAEIVLCDVDTETLMLTPETVYAACGANVDIIVPTHFAGAAMNLEPLSKAFPQAIIIDDAAHAFPTKHEDGAFVGGDTKADATVFSFYATKTLGLGEGGMITTEWEPIAQRVRQARLHGFNKAIEDRYTNVKTGWAYDIGSAGTKANMTDTVAAIGLSEIDFRQTDMTTRKHLAARYTKHLKDVVGTPVINEGHALHLYCIRVDDRDRFIERMAEQGVQCSVHFIPLHKHTFWKDLCKPEKGQFPNADAQFEKVVSLPMFTTLQSIDQDRIIEAVKSSVKG